MALWLSRTLSLIALLALLTWILAAGDVSWAVRTLAFALIPMAFIWFPAHVYRPGSGKVDDRPGRRAAIGIAVMGWLLLAIIAVVRIRVIAAQ
jgi:hypothetical protein